jgi:hypothetical protein
MTRRNPGGKWSRERPWRAARTRAWSPPGQLTATAEISGSAEQTWDRASSATAADISSGVQSISGGAEEIDQLVAMAGSLDEEVQRFTS